MQYINSCVALIKENAKSNTVVILESTSFPGTTKELVFDKLNDKKRNSRTNNKIDKRNFRKTTSNMEINQKA